ncbi:hypothetical protein KR093_004575 [Drosophila rubida]|uniref:Uncharacterized protein n=1 Tax=Drosophila rubida TaxID=30044 RepID=A0AAD4K5H0_9MUSC|nr:hypothetical protein KR093_004575 [Drosophila rubida]
MLFDSFLYSFELRTGCFVLSVLHMLFIILSLHVPMITDFVMGSWIPVFVAIERLLEFLFTILLTYGVFQRNRKLMLIWQMLVPLMILFNVAYYFYLSFVVNNLKVLFILVLSLYLITYSLMIVNSYYDELGYLEDYMKDIAYIQTHTLKKSSTSVTKTRKSDDERVVKITESAAT